MTTTLKSLRRVKEKGVTVAGPTLLIILKDSIVPLVILFRFVTYTDRCLLVKCRFLSDTLSSYRDTIGLHLSICNKTSLATICYLIFRGNYKQSLQNQKIK